MPEISSHHCVQLVPIFQNLNQEQSDAVEQIVQHRHFKAGSFLYHEGDSVSDLLIIASGQIKVSQYSAGGKEQLLYLLQAGDINGEAALVSQEHHESSAQALTDGAVCSISRVDFQKLLTEMPKLSLNVLDVLGRRLTNLEKHTTTFSTESVATRLGSYLVETASAIGHNPFKLPLKKKDLAALLGTTPETISRILTKWEQEQLIERLDSKDIRLMDEDALLMV
ncbi:Crp-like transcriptional regulator [Pediococcus argentinicus]|uniref:Crp-like transcriptional regulator n=1 Tax=Pediococcus argentinicus TaxID=480391 RepID=A0A0R2NFI1_9LACO|nr:Crp/Fnr family transcriptional regulator [Pediococcus argentinicus]KRO22387.1 Crp-like transcriptional regulator [Pediococcus argentinicus]GEP20151.1 Crp/Fnr family transcriptional regulator [Pediococcus argentinicus]